MLTKMVEPEARGEGLSRQNGRKQMQSRMLPPIIYIYIKKSKCSCKYFEYLYLILLLIFCLEIVMKAPTVVLNIHNEKMNKHIDTILDCK